MATYRGKKVSLNKVMRGDVKKFKVFVKKGNRVVKVNFGDKSMKIKKRHCQLFKQPPVSNI